jgi:hypothetical protein
MEATMSVPFRRLSACAVAATSLFLFVPVEAQEADYLARFEGTWSGAGLVARKEAEDVNKVNCTMNGAPAENGVSMNGTCRAALIFSRQIGADIRFDPSSGRYTGTYTGSTIGPAALSGKRRGDAVVMTITWPKPVRGDTKATMTINNPGNGQLSIVVTDEVEPGGPSATVTNLSLTRSS